MKRNCGRKRCVGDDCWRPPTKVNFYLPVRDASSVKSWAGGSPGGRQLSRVKRLAAEGQPRLRRLGFGGWWWGSHLEVRPGRTKALLSLGGSGWAWRWL
jgi:hypothetical protein